MELGKKNYPKDKEFVIFYFDKNSQKIVQLIKDESQNNKYGYFEYNNILNKPFGTKIFSKNEKGFIYVFPLTKFFWTKNLLHKTQILYSFDISNIIFRLNIKKGDTVIESGTGSGSLTYSLSKRVGNKGKVYSFEFNEERVNFSKDNFKNFNINNVEIIHRDVYDKGFLLDNLKENEVGCIFIDLPSPWLVINHIKIILKKGGKLCTFSPCIEQVIKTKEKLSKVGFGNFETVELLEKNYEKKSFKPKEFTFENENIELGKREYNIFIPTSNSEKTHTGYLTYSTKFID